MANKTPYKTALKELEEFIVNYSMTPTGFRYQSAEIAKPTFKKLYPILIIKKHVSESEIWKQKDKQNNFETYLDEFVSDILQSIVLGSQGFYKPSYLILRSGLENFIKCIGISQDQNVLSITSVFELIRVVKDTSFISSEPILTNTFSEIQNEYSTLCQHVHTATAAHMARTSFVGVYPRFEKPDATMLFQSTSRTSVNVLKILAWMLKGHLRKMHHTQYDVVCDALPKKFKQAINTN